MIELTKNEELILLSIYKLNEDAYGVPIRKNYKEITGKELNYGSMHNTLYLLVRRGFVVTSESQPESKKGGRRKVLYSLTSNGRKALKEAQQKYKAAWGDIPDVAFEEE